MMDNLRWILLALGAVLVAGIYIFSVISKKRKRQRFSHNYTQVDWEQAEAEGEDEAYDDLPSIDQLEAARIQHIAEGNALPSLNAESQVQEPEESLPAMSATEEPEVDEPAPYLEGLRRNLAADPVATSQVSEPEPAPYEPVQQSRGPVATDTVEAETEVIQEAAAEPVRQPVSVEESAPEVEQAPEASPEPSPEQDSFHFAEANKPIAEEEVIVLHLKARDSIGLYGPELERCFDELGIKFGDMDIYHYASKGKRILSIANSVKPGTFKPSQMSTFTTPGISLFLQLNRESDFELSEQVLLQTAKYLGHKLKADVLNADRSAYDNDAEAALTARIAEIAAHYQNG